MLITSSPVQAEAHQPAAHQAAKTLLEALAGKTSHPRLPHPGKGECISTCQSLLLKDRQAGDPQLLILVSHSLPESSIQQLWQQAHKIGGRLVFRGLIGDSFSKTQHYMHKLGINADIDPNPFSQHQVTGVPTFILTQGDKVDKLTGHISVAEALAQFQASGDLKQQARRLVHKLGGQ